MLKSDLKKKFAGHYILVCYIIQTLVKILTSRVLFICIKMYILIIIFVCYTCINAFKIC